MLIGPVFTRQVAIAPRRPKLYVARTAYALALLVLMSTAWLVLTGTQLVRDVGDLARFGSAVFQILAPLQVALATFCAALLAASEVAHEKDRRTLVLLLLTNLTNSELVLGRLSASLLNVLVMLVAALPVFLLAALLGGVSNGQIARAMAVTLAAVVCAGSLGSLLALWREKTFQALAMTVLVLVLWLVAGEVVAAGALGETLGGLPCQTVAAAMSPWQAILEASRPYAHAVPAIGAFLTPADLFLATAVAISLLLNGLAISMIRVWNPSRETEERGEGKEDRGQSLLSAGRVETEAKSAPSPESPTVGAAVELPHRHDVFSPPPSPLSSVPSPLPPLPSPLSKARRVWDNPIIWREIRTWAYGRKTLVIRLAYLVLFSLAAASLYQMIAGGQCLACGKPIGNHPPIGSLCWMLSRGQADVHAQVVLTLAPLVFLSLVLVNAQAVTSLTSERDAKALDLLLVTDLTPKEIVYGKLGGVFYNTKEMVLLPTLLCVGLWLAGSLNLENLLYLLGGLAVLYVFAAVVGLHAGMTYANSGVAVATSLGTVFFLFVGVGVCMCIMMAFSDSFQAQFLPFFTFMVFGGVGLYVVLGVRNPSTAIGLASFLCPLATFYAITSYLLGATLAVFLVTAAAYGFTTAAMLVPAICEFDVATGRTTIEE